MKKIICLFVLFLIVFQAACTPAAEQGTVIEKSYEDDRFSLQYPGDFTLYENERPPADGVTVPLPDSIALHDIVPEANEELEWQLDMVSATVRNFSPTDAAQDEGLNPRFERFLPFFESGGDTLPGINYANGMWVLASAAYPNGIYSVDSDYAPATDRLLAWNFISGAGPASLAAGKLSLISAAGDFTEVVVPDNVISAGWAPNGLDFAYILATPTTYELRWRTADGEEKLLAVDVPHSLHVSPDGRFVAFTRESHYGLNNSEPGLYVVEIETGLEIQVSALDRAGYGGVGLFWKPQWSADSSQLLLYASADDDRASTPHDSGYVWAAADGSFSHFLSDGNLLELFDVSLSSPENRPCLDTPLLFAPDLIIVGIGECLPMTEGSPVSSYPAAIALDSQTGMVKPVQISSEIGAAKLLAWDVPGESILLMQDENIFSHTISLTGSSSE